LLALAVASPAPAQEGVNYREAAASVDRDLRAELDKLAALRHKIASEKPDVARRAEESARLLRSKKRQFEVAKATQAAADHRLEQRNAQLKVWRDERLYLDGMLGEFLKNHHSGLTLPEAKLLGDSFAAASRGNDAAARAGLDLVEQVIARLPQSGRLKTFPGHAIGGNGALVEGDFAVAGPLAWFVSKEGSVAGLTSESRSLESEVVPGSGEPASIRQLLEGAGAEVIFDPTLGSALALKQLDEGLLRFLQKGGKWVIPILLLAFVSLIAAAIKWLRILGIRNLEPAFVQDVLDRVGREDFSGARQTAGTLKHPARMLLEKGIDLAGASLDEVEEALYEKYLELLPGLQKGLSIIAITAATAPLLGLLGTVTGMIKTFNQITLFGSGDAKALSGGISEALITTELGLVVAIPALMCHALLSRKVQGIKASLEWVSLAFLNSLKQWKK